ncbi:hypothetical protein AMATHDRAFT_144739 [Amanita thiersii Skay4041]|uniref:Protein N-terminal and lysine N-methyltransferase EFM7 n=1 Tax=Amanita thiersii Skay4041 TaxID=703135 RepID=A0A2A9NQK4_9AGAR|nr:hypothetical protein AMATHDRAFT_144739 [Amanita thiersii Skay4041]
MSSRDDVDHTNSHDDILLDALAFLDGKPVVDNDLITYGPLTLTVAPKEGKANTLLADHLFSPALLLAEWIERGLLPAQGQTMIELGSGSGLPSLLASTLSESPSLVVVTDYPDESIMRNLTRNVERNSESFTLGHGIHCAGYEWGRDVSHLRKFLPKQSDGFDIIILSDLLHFDTSHGALMRSLDMLLSKLPNARMYIAAGRYTTDAVCAQFLLLAEQSGFLIEEIDGGSEWQGKMAVGGLDKEALSLRKQNCRLWIGRRA